MALNKVVIAPQGFKGSLSGAEVARALADGVLDAVPDAEVVELPIADGGHGTLDVFEKAASARVMNAVVSGPLGEQTEAKWLLLDDKTAFIELAQAAGLELLSPDRLDPLRATTYGVGELVKEALNNGCRRVLIAVGGSATNDGGSGIAQALGAMFLDRQGKTLERGAAALSRLNTLNLIRLDDRIKHTEILVICDVKNTLLGERGATAVYGPQKGASGAVADELERGLANFAAVVKEATGVDMTKVVGGGAAGGAAAGLHAILNARIVAGADFVLDHIRFDEHLRGADLLIVGEGAIDESSTYDKCPAIAAKRAAARSIKTVAVGAVAGAGWEKLRDCGVSKIIAVAPQGVTDLNEATRRTPRLLTAAGREIALSLRG